MAEAQAGHSNAQQDGEQQQEGEQLDGEQQDGAEGEGGEGKQQRQAERTYTQAELDRILGKVRKNARYLGRKEAEAELVRQGASRQQAEQTVDRQQQQQKEAPKAPKREDFEHYEEYLDARADFKARTASREEQERAENERRQQRVVEERKTVEREFKKRADAVMKEIPDWAETIESAENVMITESMGEAIQESDLGPRILYHLVQNPDEADRISQLPAKAQLREIGKLEARIEAELKAKTKAKPQGEEGDEEQEGDQGEEREEESEAGAEAEGKGKDAERRADGTFKPSKKRAAPEPIETVGARSASGSKLPSDKDDIATWMRKEEERERREGRR